MRAILAFPLALSLSLSTAAFAQEQLTPDEGLSLMERGAELFLRGLMDEVEPQLEEFRGFAEELGPLMQEFSDQMGPAMADLLAQVDDLRNYQAPEILPNGDIIIRRKPDAPALPTDDGEVEL